MNQLMLVFGAVFVTISSGLHHGNFTEKPEVNLLPNNSSALINAYEILKLIATARNTTFDHLLHLLQEIMTTRRQMIFQHDLKNNLEKLKISLLEISDTDLQAQLAKLFSFYDGENYENNVGGNSTTIIFAGLLHQVALKNNLSFEEALNVYRTGKDTELKELLKTYHGLQGPFGVEIKSSGSNEKLPNEYNLNLTVFPNLTDFKQQEDEINKLFLLPSNPGEDHSETTKQTEEAVYDLLLDFAKENNMSLTEMFKVATSEEEAAEAEISNKEMPGGKNDIKSSELRTTRGTTERTTDTKTEKNFRTQEKLDVPSHLKDLSAAAISDQMPPRNKSKTRQYEDKTNELELQKYLEEYDRPRPHITEKSSLKFKSKQNIQDGFKQREETIRTRTIVNEFFSNSYREIDENVPEELNRSGTENSNYGENVSGKTRETFLNVGSRNNSTEASETGQVGSLYQLLLKLARLDDSQDVAAEVTGKKDD